MVARPVVARMEFLRKEMSFSTFPLGKQWSFDWERGRYSFFLKSPRTMGTLVTCKEGGGQEAPVWEKSWHLQHVWCQGGLQFRDLCAKARTMDL